MCLKKVPVLVDEGGTPTDGSLSVPKATFDAAAQAERDAIGSAGSKVTALVWGWAWTLPVGTCSPIDFSTRLGTMVIDPCSNSGVLMLRQLMGYLFFVLTGAYVWRSATGSIAGSA